MVLTRGERGGLSALVSLFVIVGLAGSATYVGIQSLTEPADDSKMPTMREIQEERSCEKVRQFGSQQEFVDYVGWVPENRVYHAYEWDAVGDAPSLGGSASSGDSMTTFSPTNNQVAGVDEADIVKTDGEYIYVVSGEEVVVLKAYPPLEAGVVSRIPIDGTVEGLFVNGDRLVVIESAWSRDYYWIEDVGLTQPTRLLVYDLSDIAAPALARNVSLDGYYESARMIGPYVYLLANHYVYWAADDLVYPSIWTDGVKDGLSYADIGYFDGTYGSYQVSMVIGLDVTGDDEPSFEAYVGSSSGTVYVSRENVYVAGWASSAWGSWSGASTAIHKLSISEGETNYECSALVPGSVLNQFSMDEHEGHLRVATTGSRAQAATPDAPPVRISRPVVNNVYVLDENMNLVGALEGLAPGETIHSARFVGERGYLVTFKKTDPFFVIDLSDAEDPQVLGHLKIPGFSDYMHPYDENHVIGIGKDTVEAAMGDFAWFQGVKLSFFDVTDVNNPREVSKAVIGDRGTSSEALNDHRAFLFIPSEGLIVIPIDLALVDEGKHPGGGPANTYGDYVWQGAYVLSVDLNGFQYRGRISHEGDAVCENASEYWYAYYSNCRVTRSLFIEDVLYTISPAMVKMNDLSGLNEIGSVRLQEG